MPEQKIKILLVEDEAMIVEMYKVRFEEEGYEVLTTDQGSQALEIARENKPDIILLDVILPEMDGFSILSELKDSAKTKNIPVLMLTNLGQESDLEKGKKLGAADYFIKAQHTPVEILQKIKDLLK